MSKKIYVQSGSGGYGPRVFVPYQNVAEVSDFLNEHSMWGGHDKDCGLALSWEFPNHKVMMAHLASLVYLGYTIEKMTLSNAHYVWQEIKTYRTRHNYLAEYMENE